MVDWSERDLQQLPHDEIMALLDRLERKPSADLWKELNNRLITEGECWYSAGYAALPRLSALAQMGAEEHRQAAIQLASMIIMTLHRHHTDDDLVRADPSALATLHHLTLSRLPGMTGDQFRWYFQAAAAFAGYTFWATISLDFSDEHYRIECPHCATLLMIVIGDYGRYSAIRDEWAGDIHRIPIRPANPAILDVFRQRMHDTAAACGDSVLADGLTYLFGDATCCNCDITFNIADWYEAQNSPAQPIDPVIPRVDRSY